MKRVNGYLDLDEYFKRILKRKNINRDILENKKIIQIALGGANTMFWFKYFGVPILFKLFDHEYSVYSELISEKLANYLEIPHAQYDAATFMNKKGVISYSFKKENYSYIALEDIMRYYLTNKNLNITENSTNVYNDNYLRNCNAIDFDYAFTNLEDIWNALEHYLYNTHEFNMDLIPEMSEKIMIQLTDYFEYQIISGNFDMHTGNISLAIANDYSDIKLTPLYDNEDMFKLGNDIRYIFTTKPRLNVDRETFKNSNDAIDALRRYLEISDSFFVNKFINKINKLDLTTIEIIFKEVENKLEISIPFEIKENFKLEFNSNLKKIKSLIKELENKKRS